MSIDRGFQPAHTLALRLFVAGCAFYGFGNAVPSAYAQPKAPKNGSAAPKASGQNNVRRVEVDTQGGTNILVHVIRDYEAVSVEDIRTSLRDRTRISIDDVHGQQITYYASDGKAFLWYPGNEAILQGRWKAEPSYLEYIEKGRTLRRIAEAKACFNYGPSSHNPATGHAGAGWECSPPGGLAKYPYRNLSGDVFGLSVRKAVPFVLQRGRSLSMEDLQARIGS